MARRRRGRKGGRKSKAIPISGVLPVVPAVMTAYAYRAAGPVSMVRNGLYVLTGFDISGESAFSYKNAGKTLGLALVGIAGHKIANKTGVNRAVKKMTFGFLQF